MTKSRIAGLSLAIALTLSATVAAAQRIFADFNGPWNVTVQGPQGPMNSVLTIKQHGDTLSGVFESELGTAPINGMAKGDSIKFVFALDAGGQQMSLQATAALKDKDNLNGVIEAAGMGGFPFTATRKAP